MQKTKTKKSKEFENFENLARHIINVPKKNDRVKEKEKKENSRESGKVNHFRFLFFPLLT